MLALYLLAAIFALLLIAAFMSNRTVVVTNISPDALKRATVYYYLPETLLKIKASVRIAVVYDADAKNIADSQVVEQGFVVTTDMVADTTDLLALNYRSNPFMADDLKFGVNAKGLLETVNVTTEDKTAAVVTQVAGAPQLILGGAKGVSGATDPNILVKIKDYTADFTVKASTLAAGAYPIPWTILVANDMGKDQFVPVDAGFRVSAPDLRPRAGTLADQIKPVATDGSKVPGILTRPLRNIELKFSPLTSGLDNVLPVDATIADASKLILVPVERTPFVKRVNNIAIQDGIITSNAINNPALVEGFVSIPIDMAKALVSIPGQLIQFRFNNTEGLKKLEASKLQYEQSIAETRKWEARKDLEADNLKIELEKGRILNEKALEQYRLETLKAVQTAETNQLTTQKELEKLRKEVEALKDKPA